MKLFSLSSLDSKDFMIYAIVGIFHDFATKWPNGLLTGRNSLPPLRNVVTKQLSSAPLISSIEQTDILKCKIFCLCNLNCPTLDAQRISSPSSPTSDLASERIMKTYLIKDAFDVNPVSSFVKLDQTFINSRDDCEKWKMTKWGLS